MSHDDPATGNADDNPFVKHYHKPQDEKRMVVILPEQDFDAWIQAPAADNREFLRQVPADGPQAEVPTPACK